MSASIQLQNNNLTFLGRHWTEHCVLRRYFDSDHQLSILSFGCSTGEELISIKSLFPCAKLYGCDIDWHNLIKARALLGKDACIFHSNESTIENHGPFDIILCNSVLLTSGSNNQTPSRGIDPTLWKDTISLLDSCLKPGGIIQIINSNIPFRLHPKFDNYQVLQSSLFNGPNFVDLFDLDGTQLCSGVSGAGWSGMLHRHIAREGWQQLIPSDLEDIHFQKKEGDKAKPKYLLDEKIPNLSSNNFLASGSTSYRPQIPLNDFRSSFTIVEVSWRAIKVDAVSLERVSKRIWFDGNCISTKKASIDMIGAEATAFIESVIGQRSSRISFESLLNARAIRSNSF